MSPVIVAILGLLAVVLAASLPVWLVNRGQVRARKEERAEREARDLAEGNRQKEVAEQASKAADLLVKANELVAATLEKSEIRKGKAEEEVARVAAETAASVPVEHRGMLVTLIFPNGERQDVRLIDAPRAGDHVRLANGSNDPSWIVEMVMWAEAKQGKEPAVVVVVRPRSVQEAESPVPHGQHGQERPAKRGERTANKVADRMTEDHDLPSRTRGSSSPPPS